jgi:hypothetical protein
MIVANKIDLEEERQVSKQRGLDYASSKQLAFYEVSAKSGTNNELIFTSKAEDIILLLQSYRVLLSNQLKIKKYQRILIGVK